MARGRSDHPITSTHGALVYAIGDVHGRLDLLKDLVVRIREDAKPIPRRPALVLLGDYVDRGPESCGVLEYLIDLSRDADLDTIFLKGNHEAVLARFLVDASVGPSWAGFGGRETLASYGVAAPRATRDWNLARLGLLDAMPAEHKHFLRSLPNYSTVGDYVLVHAGLRPGVRLENQKEADLLWIREPFLSHRRPCASVVVHGHTPTKTVSMLGCRIGIDTEAHISGILTAIRLFGIDRSVIDTRATGAPRLTPSTVQARSASHHVPLVLGQ